MIATGFYTISGRGNTRSGPAKRLLSRSQPGPLLLLADALRVIVAWSEFGKLRTDPGRTQLIGESTSGTVWLRRCERLGDIPNAHLRATHLGDPRWHAAARSTTANQAVVPPRIPALGCNTLSNSISLRDYQVRISVF